MRHSHRTMTIHSMPTRSWQSSLLRVSVLLWFLATSVGWPLALISGPQQLAEVGERTAASDCRCSLTKKLSGACCCREIRSSSRAANKVGSGSCCGQRIKASATSQVTVASATKLQPAEHPRCDDATKGEHEVATIASADRCSCGPDSSSDFHSLSQLALPLMPEEPLHFAADVVLITNPFQQVPSLRHEPLEPPPRDEFCA